jgi:hypothetical protein
MQRNVTALENGSDAHCKLLPAGVALLATDCWLAGFAHYAIKRASPAHSSAMRANDAIRPDDRFQPIEGGLLILEVEFA